MRKHFIIAYIVCIHVFLGFILLKSDFLERVSHKLGHGPTSQNEITGYYNDMVCFHSRMDGNVPKGATVFIGDSFIQGLCVSAVVPESVNYGIGGDTTVGVLQRLPVYRSLSRAGAVVVAIGFNDMKFRSNEEILRRYSAIAERMPHNIPVVFSALLPVDEKNSEKLRGKNQRIQAINADLKAVTIQTKNLVFADPGPSLVDSQGNLKEEYQDGDGIHLNAKGNAIWIIELQKTLKKAKQSALLDMDSAAVPVRQ